MIKRIKNKGAKSQNLGSPHGPVQTLHRSDMDAYMARAHGWYGKRKRPEMPMMGMMMLRSR